jgi:hypothetical protein
MKTISNGIIIMKNGKFIKLYETIYDRFKQGHGLLEGDVVKLKDGYKTSEQYKALPTSIQVRLEDSEKSGYNLRVGRLHTPNAQYGSMGYVALPATHADLYQERAPGAFGNLVTIPIGLLEPIDTGVNLPPVSKNNKRSGKEAPYQKPSKKGKNKDAATDEQTKVGEEQNYAKKGDYELATKNKKPSVGANSYDDSKPSTNYKPLAKNGKKPKTLKESMESIENVYMGILNEDIDLEADAEVNENPGLSRKPQVTINGKEVDLKSLELDGVEMNDFPDFVDAFIVSGSFKDGTMMNDDEIDELNIDYPEITQELAHDSLHEADKPAANEDMGDTTGTTSEVTHNPEEMEQTSAYEAKNYMGEREFQTYAGWKRACKMIKPDANFTGDRDIDSCEVGEWDGAVGSIFNKPTKADSK